MPKRPIIRAGESDPLWYKRAVIYQAHVRSFHDSNNDGVGDFPGLTRRLDYLQSLGVSAIWLLPFYPSPLKDDGYDIADYFAINPIYGTLADFKQFLAEAHRRSLRVITELVVNHTSDQHAWFQQSRRARPGSKWRDYYVWSDDPKRYAEARIIFRDFEISNWTWDARANAYYWHRFYSHQPDLNFDNPQVHEEIIRVLEFWLDLGVDGLRLDAVPYLYEREGTNCENLPETHAFLKKLRRHIDAKYGDRMLLAEANQWPEDAVQYFGSGRGDECHMAFHFPLMPRLFMAVRMEDRVPIVDILEQTPPIPETSQWAVFLRNHDELTLEMVTEEERDYMYRMYASDARARINLGIRRRLAPLLNDDRRRIELLNVLLLSMPGTPVLYYGDEIGMGDNIYLGDRNGVRTPMHWSSDKNAGFSRANPQSLFLPIILDPEYHYEAVNVEAQQRNPNSLLSWTRRILALRQRWPVLGQGTLRFLRPENRKILAFVRELGDVRVLVVANLSRHAQAVQLDLGEFRGFTPVEMFGRTRFPVIGETTYPLAISPHGYFWFSLEPAQVIQPSGAGGVATLADLPLVMAPGSWEDLLEEAGSAALLGHLPRYIRAQRWFGGKSKEIHAVTLFDVIPVSLGAVRAQWLLLNVDYVEGDPKVYSMPVSFATGEAAERLMRDFPHAVILRVRENDGTEGVLYDTTVSPQFADALLEAIGRKKVMHGREGHLAAVHTSAFKALRGAEKPEPALSRAEQSNSSIIYGDRMILKLFRRPEAGLNPDLEISRFLSARKFPHIPALAGALEYQRQGEMRSIGILDRFIPNAKDGWEYTLDALSRYFERVVSYVEEGRPGPSRPIEYIDPVAAEPPAEVVETIGTYLESARVLGEITGQLHLALGAGEAPDFAPEPFSPHYQRSLYQSMRNLLIETFQLLRRKRPDLPEEVKAEAAAVLDLESEILGRYRALLTSRVGAMRIRCHGDFHLGQVLYTGRDFIILDFEGEPARALSARRLKRSPLNDVAGMLRSFHYAAYTALEQLEEHGPIAREKHGPFLEWALYWYSWVAATFVNAYLRTMGASPLLPDGRPELRVLLEAYLLDKAVYEIGYELNNRPDWLSIPFDGVLALLRSAPVAPESAAG